MFKKIRKFIIGLFSKKQKRPTGCKAALLAAFLRGESFTVEGANDFAGTKSARQIISALRKEGYNIVSEWAYIEGQRPFKVYWYEKDERANVFVSGNEEERGEDYECLLNLQSE